MGSKPRPPSRVHLPPVTINWLIQSWPPGHSNSRMKVRWADLSTPSKDLPLHVTATPQLVPRRLSSPLELEIGKLPARGHESPRWPDFPISGIFLTVTHRVRIRMTPFLIFSASYLISFDRIGGYHYGSCCGAKKSRTRNMLVSSFWERRLHRKPVSRQVLRAYLVWGQKNYIDTAKKAYSVLAGTHASNMNMHEPT